MHSSNPTASCDLASPRSRIKTNARRDSAPGAGVPWSAQCELRYDAVPRNSRWGLSIVSNARQGSRRRTAPRGLWSGTRQPLRARWVVYSRRCGGGPSWSPSNQAWLSARFFHAFSMRLKRALSCGVAAVSAFSAQFSAFLRRSSDFCIVRLLHHGTCN
jgi:hypothetical protein